MRGAGWIAAILFAALWLTPARAAIGFADRLPPVERIITDYSGGSAFEARTRQAAACSVMTRAVELLMGPRYYRSEWEGSEQAHREGYASCVGERMPKPGTSNADRREIMSAYSGLQSDPQFITEVRGRYPTLQDRRAVEQQEAEWNVMLAKQRVSASEGFPGFEGAQSAQQLRDAKMKEYMFKLLAGCVVALLVGGWGVLRGLQPVVVDTSASPAKLSVAGRKFTLHDTAGVVADMNNDRSVTHYPGTDTYDQNGRWVSSTAGYSVSSTTQTIFVIDAEGRERALQFYDWDIVARPGHEIATVWGIRQGKERGPYLKFRNVTLDKSLTSFGALNQMFGISGWFLFFFAIGLAPIAFALTMLATKGQGIGKAAIIALALVIAAIWLVRNITKGRARAFARDQLSAILDRAAKDARAASDRLLAPLQPT